MARRELSFSAASSNKSIYKSSNTCDNSYSSSSGFSVEERVLKVIDESEIELFPFELASKIHAKRSSVRVILRKLLDKGLILQPYPGAYCNKITYGMRFVPLCVHFRCISHKLNSARAFDIKDGFRKLKNFSRAAKFRKHLEAEPNAN